MNFLEHLQENYEAEIINKIISSFESERTHCLILNTAYYDESKLFDVNISKKHPFISNAFYFCIKYKITLWLRKKLKEIISTL